jgi:hypothetical protein
MKSIQQVYDRRRATSINNVLQSNACDAGEVLDCQVVDRSDAGAAVEQWRCTRSRDGEEVRKRLDFVFGMRHEDERILSNHADRREVVDGPIREVLEYGCVRRVPSWNGNEGVAIGRSLGDPRRRYRS